MITSRRPTVNDVAARAGVSPKTVSNVLTGAYAVKPETRERVEAAMDELQYVPNLSARGLRNGRAGVIALALPDLATAYSASLVQQFVRLARERGLAVQVEETGAEPEREFELLSRARAHLVDGVVLNPVTIEDSAAAHSDRLPPVVLIGEVEQSRTDQVRIDSVAAAKTMTEHLLERGARRIAVVGAPGGGFQTATAHQRMQGVAEAMTAAGAAIDPALVLSVDSWTPTAADIALGSLLDGGGEPPDAVFAFTDSMALGVLGALWRRGLRTPEDVLVCGFDDVEEAAHASPPLTTVGFDREAFAAAALGLLVDRFTDRATPPRVLTMPHHVVIRESTTR